MLTSPPAVTERPAYLLQPFQVLLQLLLLLPDSLGHESVSLLHQHLCPHEDHVHAFLHFLLYSIPQLLLEMISLLFQFAQGLEMERKPAYEQNFSARTCRGSSHMTQMSHLHLFLCFILCFLKVFSLVLHMCRLRHRQKPSD